MTQPVQVETPSNCIIYDWLTFSVPDIEYASMIQFLGLSGIQWQTGLGSKLHYDERWAFEGMSVHWSGDQTRRNPGCCFEFSGQGCRAFETFGSMSFDDLLSWIVDRGYKITRLDIALDDFTGLIDLQTMFDKANRYEYTCRSEKCETFNTRPDRDPKHAALSVCHGSRSSNLFIRCYDKRCERQAYDEFDHWVRLEIQLRGDNSLGFASAPGSIGSKFRSVLAQYLNYREPNVSDLDHPHRWEVSSWWVSLLDGAEGISIASKKDLDYNKLRLDSYVYGQAVNAIKAEIAIDGVDAFLKRIQEDSAPGFKPKYERLVRDNPKNLEAERQYFKELGLDV